MFRGGPSQVQILSPQSKNKEYHIVFLIFCFEKMNEPATEGGAGSNLIFVINLLLFPENQGFP